MTPPRPAKRPPAAAPLPRAPTSAVAAPATGAGPERPARDSLDARVDTGHSMGAEVAARAVLALLLSTDLLLIVLNLLHLATPYFADERYSVAADRGFGEIVQYVKLYWIALSFAWAGLRTPERAYLVWPPVFGYLLLDDAFSLHEKLGATLAERLGIPPRMGLLPRDFGEIAVLALAASASLLLVAAGYWRGSAAFRRTTRQTVAFLAVFAIFAVAVDAVHSVARVGPRLLDHTLAVLEDGGEMLTLSALCACVVAPLLARHAAHRGGEW